MKRWKRLLNAFFVVACFALLAGCAAFNGGIDPTKEQSTIRLYLEGQKADQTTSGTVAVTRNKYLYTIQREPALDESDVAKVSVIESDDGTYTLQLNMRDHGALLLDMLTASNKGKHIIVFSQFPTPGKHKEKKKKSADDADVLVKEGAPKETEKEGKRQSAWLAAVLIRDRISNGVFRFTPDATKEETLRIARGLKNVINTKKTEDKEKL
jgi:hypothetical protein